MNYLLVAVIAVGLCWGAAIFLIVGGLVPGRPSLSAALAHLEGRRHEAVDTTQPRTRAEQWGGWVHRHSPIPVARRTQQMLQLQDISLAEFHARKVLYAVLAAAVPSIVGAFTAILGVPVGLIPGGLTVLGAIVGWFLPDLTIRQQARSVRQDAAESLFTYFDLVTLERLANASAVQALTSSAEVSDSPLFRQIRAALERSRLEQRPPYDNLAELAHRLDLPQLNDLVDVMRTDEHGAALADNLRSRVRELRDEHLTATRLSATQVSENMTLPMTIPALLFALLFLVPPVLRLVGQ